MLETLTGSTFEFRDPVLLALALFAPLVFWLSARRRGSVTFSSLSLLPAARKVCDLDCDGCHPDS